MGAGQVLGDIIGAGAVPVVRLTEGLPTGRREPDHRMPQVRPGRPRSQQQQCDAIMGGPPGHQFE